MQRKLAGGHRPFGQHQAAALEGRSASARRNSIKTASFRFKIRSSGWCGHTHEPISEAGGIDGSVVGGSVVGGGVGVSCARDAEEEDVNRFEPETRAVAHGRA